MYSFKFIFEIPFTDSTRIIEVNNFTLNEARAQFRKIIKAESENLLEMLEPIEFIEPIINELQINE